METDLTQAREENNRLRSELESLQQSQQSAKERARIAIENLVSENKKLFYEVAALEGKASEMRRERTELMNQLRSKSPGGQ